MHKCWKSQNGYDLDEYSTSPQYFHVHVSWLLPYLNSLNFSHDLSASPALRVVSFPQPLLSFLLDSESTALVTCIHAPTVRAIGHASATTAAHRPPHLRHYYLSGYASRVCIFMALSAHAPAVRSEFRLSGNSTLTCKAWRTLRPAPDSRQPPIGPSFCSITYL